MYQWISRLSFYMLVLFGFLASDLRAADKPEKLAIVVVPPSGESALAEWIAHKSQRGYRVVTLPSMADAEQLQRSIADTVRANRATKVFVVLAADASPINQAELSAGFNIPMFYLPSRAVIAFGGSEFIATDYLYGDIDHDGIAECSVGRIPAKSPEQLRILLERSVAYEKNLRPGDWQYEMNLTAGVGGFSFLADMAISSFAKALLLEGVPPQYMLHLTHASEDSPYFPSGQRFKDNVVKSLNNGGLFWIYIGHGSVTHLDHVMHQGNFFPILSENNIQELNSRKHGSIAVLLACSSGAMDATKDCLAESMVRHPRGPIAAIASSRVSMPYGMSALAREMLKRTFNDHDHTVGEVLMHGKRAVALAEETDDEKRESLSLDQMMHSMAAALSPADHDLKQERVEHLWLLNLIGDPTLPIPTSGNLEFTSNRSDNGTISVDVDSPIAGELFVQCQVERGTLSKSALELNSQLNKQKKSTGSFTDDELEQRYNAANEIALTSVNVAISKGANSVTIALPEQAPDKFLLRVSVANESESYVGAQHIGQQ